MMQSCKNTYKCLECILVQTNPIKYNLCKIKWVRIGAAVKIKYKAEQFSDNFMMHVFLFNALCIRGYSTCIQQMQNDKPRLFFVDL